MARQLTECPLPMSSRDKDRLRKAWGQPLAFTPAPLGLKATVQTTGSATRTIQTRSGVEASCAYSPPLAANCWHRLDRNDNRQPLSHHTTELFPLGDGRKRLVGSRVVRTCRFSAVHTQLVGSRLAPVLVNSAQHP
mmetsp:Transcript_98153/g.227623  ORF Transcript_98153/g.227623 Transcript_98153/m.227623 type:complete len:136 (+) Transcript_98153:55-462(+)